MRYKTIDPIISAWAIKHNLHLYTFSRDEEVRSVDLVGPNGIKCQLWIIAPDQDGNIQIHIWDYKRQHEKFTTTIVDFLSSLENAYSIASQWLARTSKEES